jgi:hypothetical protein
LFRGYLRGEPGMKILIAEYYHFQKTVSRAVEIYLRLHSNAD